MHQHRYHTDARENRMIWKVNTASLGVISRGGRSSAERDDKKRARRSGAQEAVAAAAAGVVQKMHPHPKGVTRRRHTGVFIHGGISREEPRDITQHTEGRNHATDSCILPRTGNLAEKLMSRQERGKKTGTQAAAPSSAAVTAKKKKGRREHKPHDDTVGTAVSAKNKNNEIACW